MPLWSLVPPNRYVLSSRQSALNPIPAGLGVGFIHADVASYHTPRALIAQGYERHHVGLIDFSCSEMLCERPTWSQREMLLHYSYKRWSECSRYRDVLQ